MQITRQADYAIRAVHYLTQHPEIARTATSDIARKQDIPHSFLAKIISQLSIAGIIHTTRGTKGGVSLARDPADISLLDVVVAIDGPVALNECTIDSDFCHRTENCPMHSIWCDARDDLVKKLGSSYFSQLA